MTLAHSPFDTGRERHHLSRTLILHWPSDGGRPSDILHLCRDIPLGRHNPMAHQPRECLAHVLVEPDRCSVRMQLTAIPTVGGFSTPLLSYFGAVSFIRRGRETLYEGYKKVRCPTRPSSPCRCPCICLNDRHRWLQHYGSAFKIPLLDRWMVIVSGPKLVEDIRRRPEDELSFTATVETVSSSVAWGAAAESLILSCFK